MAATHDSRSEPARDPVEDDTRRAEDGPPDGGETGAAAAASDTVSRTVKPIRDFRTPRLRLRPAVPSDAEALAPLRRSGPEPHMRLPGSLEEERAAIARHRIEHYEARGYGNLIIELRESGEVVGTGGLMAADPLGVEEPEIVLWIARPYRGRGFAEEALRAVMGWARRDLGFDSVLAAVHPENTTSQGLLRVYGFDPICRVDYRGESNVPVYRVPTDATFRRHPPRHRDGTRPSGS